MRFGNSEGTGKRRCFAPTSQNSGTRKWNGYPVHPSKECYESPPDRFVSRDQGSSRSRGLKKLDLSC